jgi:hypothetical protein
MLDLKDIRRELREDLRPRKMIRYALVPHFGGIMNPVKDVFALLVRTIALLFVQSNLLPKNHPVLQGEVRGVGAIWLMIVDASANLKFTKQNIPQIAIFYAIVGMIVFSVLGTLTFLLRLGVGHAHAQTSIDLTGGVDTSGMFTDSTSGNAYNWINNILPYANTGASGIAGAVGKMLGIYNAGIAVLATFIALWTIIMMILDSAHHGEIGGKRHSALYFSLRMCLAIGLLVPVSNGYNTIQVIAVQIAHAGSGLANKVWLGFEQQLVSLTATAAQQSQPFDDAALQRFSVDVSCFVGMASGGKSKRECNDCCPGWAAAVRNLFNCIIYGKYSAFKLAIDADIDIDIAWHRCGCCCVSVGNSLSGKF